jgi:DNA-directed RNA polymerase, mitochondrial
VNRCAAEGIDSIVCVHDSFGTHAGDMDNLSLVLREKFLDIYKGGRLLYDYRDEVSKYLGVELPEPPMINTLDISKVTESEFFFS